MALHLLAELDLNPAQLTLAEWEPALSFEVKARLLKLLRLKSQRNDSDKAALARRMDTLLAGLVNIDPVRSRGALRVITALILPILLRF